MRHLAFDDNKATQQCPCGSRTDPRRTCRCSTGDIQRYRGRLSGPLLDRIDIHVEVPALTFDELQSQNTNGMSSAEVRTIVQTTRERQRNRYNGAYTCNAHIDSRAIRQHCKLDPPGAELLQTAIDRLGFSARAYDKVLRVARTLADLEAQDAISQQHVAEAIQYRSLDREGL